MGGFGDERFTGKSLRKKNDPIISRSIDLMTQIKKTLILLKSLEARNQRERETDFPQNLSKDA